MAADGTIKLSTELDSKGAEDGMSKLGNVIKGGATIAAAGFGIVSTALVAVAKQALDAVGQIEQSIGGIETLFGKSAQTVIQNAKDAFSTAGLSANDYMQQVTSFSARLIQGLKGDTDKAAEISNMAIIDMADNVNKMGSSMESVQYAYSGFSRGIFTMLDNLKLGRTRYCSV